jgi:transcription antitermination factor NusG
MLQLHWYAIYVRSRSEKVVYARLCEQGIEAYLPLQKTLRQWHDRKKMVEMPLFRSYVFVRTNYKKYHIVRAIDGVAGFVSFEFQPAKIPDYQIEFLKMLLKSTDKFEVSNDIFEYGEMVEVFRGPLTGFRGTLVTYKEKKRALLQIDAINQSLLVEIHPSSLKRIQE